MLLEIFPSHLIRLMRLDVTTDENFDYSILSTLLKTREVGSWSMKLILIPCVDTVRLNLFKKVLGYLQ
jgi:hypothetical protein